MKMRRLYTLLAVWVVLMAGPVTLVSLGVLGAVDTHRSVSGSLALCWVLGYLAQFGVFMWIMNVAGSQGGIWRTAISTSCRFRWPPDVQSFSLAIRSIRCRTEPAFAG